VAGVKIVMRQSRDGVTHIIDMTPLENEGGFWASLPNATVTLIWFMRTLAWVWVVKGLFNWAVVLGLQPRFGDFAMLPHALQATIVFFACVDLLAAVGLWLAAPWGGILWLLCAVIEATSPVLGARGTFVGALDVALNVALMSIYFILSWRARAEID
jgi:hypothetical protein